MVASDASGLTLTDLLSEQMPPITRQAQLSMRYRDYVSMQTLVLPLAPDSILQDAAANARFWTRAQRVTPPPEVYVSGAAALFLMRRAVSDGSECRGAPGRDPGAAAARLLGGVQPVRPAVRDLLLQSSQRPAPHHAILSWASASHASRKARSTSAISTPNSMTSLMARRGKARHISC